MASFSSQGPNSLVPDLLKVQKETLFDSMLAPLIRLGYDECTIVCHCCTFLQCLLWRFLSVISYILYIWRLGLYNSLLPCFLDHFSRQEIMICFCVDFQPDVTAPGVNIMAAWSPLASPTGLPFDTRAVQYNIISGTSMSCPHTTGLATLLKAVNPHWSPGAIKSAIMSTGKNTLSGGGAEQHLFLFPIRVLLHVWF